MAAESITTVKDAAIQAARIPASTPQRAIMRGIVSEG